MCLNTPKLQEHYYCQISFFFFLFDFIFVILLHLLGAINFLLKILKTQIQENMSDFLHYFHHIIKMFWFDSYQFTWPVSFGAWNWFLSSFMKHLIMCLSERERSNVWPFINMIFPHLHTSLYLQHYTPVQLQQNVW